MLSVVRRARAPPVASEPVKAALGIRPNGDTEITPDMSQVHSEDLKKIYTYVDEHVDEHVENLQRWIRQPSISNSGEGIPESAEMVKGFFEQLGCQESRVYDVGTTEWGSQGNPVVYARCDEGAPRTLVIYWMYDTMPVTQPDAWLAPPFEGRLVEQAPFKKVLIGRGATNSKGPQMVQLNAFTAIKAVTGKLPVNLIFVAEGDEERMSIGFRQFVRTHPELFKGAEAMYRFGGQSAGGGGELSGGSEGCVYVELTTSGAKWGRGPTVSDIHGGNKRSVDSPAWRHMQMLKTLVSDDGNRVLIPGFYENIEPLTPTETAKLAGGREERRSESGSREPGRRAFHRRRSARVPEDGALRHVHEPRRHLGRQHVRGRRRRHPSEQDHVEAQLPLPAEAGRHRHHEEAAGTSRREQASRTSR